MHLDCRQKARNNYTGSGADLARRTFSLTASSRASSCCRRRAAAGSASAASPICCFHSNCDVMTSTSRRKMSTTGLVFIPAPQQHQTDPQIRNQPTNFRPPRKEPSHPQQARSQQLKADAGRGRGDRLDLSRRTRKGELPRKAPDLPGQGCVGPDEERWRLQVLPCPGVVGDSRTAAGGGSG